ncbi:MAG: hypothetical protein IJ737_06685 [Ruminococcus sp.]|nr:hypothetical protein [Ruminococcus sp.]
MNMKKIALCFILSLSVLLCSCGLIKKKSHEYEVKVINFSQYMGEGMGGMSGKTVIDTAENEKMSGEVRDLITDIIDNHEVLSSREKQRLAGGADLQFVVTKNGKDYAVIDFQDPLIVTFAGESGMRETWKISDEQGQKLDQLVTDITREFGNLEPDTTATFTRRHVD